MPSAAAVPSARKPLPFEYVTLFGSFEAIKWVQWALAVPTLSHRISLDDDAYFTCPHTVERTMELLRKYPRAGAIALPYVERTSTQLVLNTVKEDKRVLF